MGKWGASCISIILLLLLEICAGSVQHKGSLDRGFEGSQMHWIDNNGKFLVSNNSNFAFGFTTSAKDVTRFLLVVIHMSSSTTVWTANGGSPVKNSDSFRFDDSGNAHLDSGGSTVWSTNTSNKRVSAMELLNNGNLVLVGSDGIFIWQSFSNITDTHLPVFIIIVIVIVTLLVVLTMVFARYHFYRKREKGPEADRESLEEDSFLESLSGMPIRFSYKDLQTATGDFSVKLGQGGFGSVYKGSLPDGTRIAVKKLEGIGQGKKEFRAEVSIIGNIHHLHLVRLKGFCSEGSHRLLAYEFMANGSLDKWLFMKDESTTLDWNTRYNRAMGTAKGLTYLHEDCDVKILHCDIKPENVLLDDHFMAKVGDFGLAKLMTRDQSHVFTTLRGTRGYLAPEWITSYAISEKSDVYSFGVVLLELLSGRKSYSPWEGSKKCHFPSYAFKMLGEGKVREIMDSKMQMDEGDERAGVAVRVALWCIQDDMNLRPPMTKVVQMLEGLCLVPPPPPPTASQWHCSAFLKPEERTSSGCNNDAYLTAVRLSGPR